MKVIRMKPVGIGAQNRAKRTTSGPPHLSQSGAVVFGVPPLQHSNFASRIQFDPGNINCAAKSMFGQPPRGRRIAIATGIVRHDTQRRDAPAFSPNRGLGAIDDPTLQRRRRAAINGRLGRKAHACDRFHAHCAFNAASPASVDPANRFALDIRVTTNLPTRMRNPCGFGCALNRAWPWVGRIDRASVSGKNENNIYSAGSIVLARACASISGRSYGRAVGRIGDGTST